MIALFVVVAGLVVGVPTLALSVGTTEPVRSCGTVFGDGFRVEATPITSCGAAREIGLRALTSGVRREPFPIEGWDCYRSHRFPVLDECEARHRSVGGSGELSVVPVYP